MDKVLGHLMHSIALHENNEIFVYSDLLASQIPESYAANAFNLTRDALFRYSIIRLCALWERDTSAAAETIPRVVHIVDNRAVISALMQDTCSLWAENVPRISHAYEDPQEAAGIQEAIEQSEWSFGRQQGARAGWELRRAIRNTKAVMFSPEWARLQNFRDKHIAHAIASTRREIAGGPIALPERRAEIDLLDKTITVVRDLYCWVNGSDFDFKNSREIRRGHSEALWEGCTIKPLR